MSIFSTLVVEAVTSELEYHDSEGHNLQILLKVISEGEESTASFVSSCVLAIGAGHSLGDSG